MEFDSRTTMTLLRTDALLVDTLVGGEGLSVSMEGSDTVSGAQDVSAPILDTAANLDIGGGTGANGGASSAGVSSARRRGPSGALGGVEGGGEDVDGSVTGALDVGGAVVQDEDEGEEDVATSAADKARGLMDFPDEILLYIFSYLDLPDLALLARLSPALAPLTADPVLHLQRLRIVSPSRVSHGLFARGPHGQLLRPSVGDLVQRGVLRGLGIERAWRMGGYWGSARSKLQYENGRAVARRLACSTLATQLRRRAAGGGPSMIKTPAAAVGHPDIRPVVAANSLVHIVHYPQQVCPDVEGASPQIARALLPTMRKLKWCLQRDRLARVFKTSGVSCGSVGAWLATPAGAERGWRVLVRERDEEKLRLAVCPDIRKARGVFEALAGAG